MGNNRTPTPGGEGQARLLQIGLFSPEMSAGAPVWEYNVPSW